MMAGQRRVRGISLPLIVLCLGLSTLIYYLAEEPLQIQPPNTGKRGAQNIPELPNYGGYKTLDLAALNETITRPLFAETRRPPESDPEAPTEQGAVPKANVKTSRFEHTLVGIFIVENNKLALLRPKRRGPLVRVGVGDEIDGWKIIDITLEHVELEQSGESQILTPKPTVRQKPKSKPTPRPRRRTAPTLKKDQAA
jgi:hypothetical protein